MNTVDIIVPCYNEAEGLEYFYTETMKTISLIKDYNFRFLLVDDGSKDNTSFVMRTLASKNDNITYLTFSRNFGKEAAMYAGLKYSSADYVIIMDADLQHPPYLIPYMIEGIKEGYDACAAMRSSRKGESKIRSLFSKMFYKMSNKLSDIELVQSAVDYRIMSRQMVDAVLSLSEVQRFSKGIFTWVGFNTKWLPYENVERVIGTTKWSFWGLFKYAIDGITAFSTAPLRLVSGMGFLICVISFFYILITITTTLITGIEVPGYASTLSAVLFLGGIVELSIGILGEYIGHIYMEVKDRPIYILKETNLSSKELIDQKIIAPRNDI